MGTGTILGSRYGRERDKKVEEEHTQNIRYSRTHADETSSSAAPAELYDSSTDQAVCRPSFQTDTSSGLWTLSSMAKRPVFHSY